MDLRGEEPEVVGTAVHESARSGADVRYAVSHSARARHTASSPRARLAAMSSYVRSAGGLLGQTGTADGGGLAVWRSPTSHRTARIRVTGEVDLATIGTLQEAIAKALADGPERLVMDLAGVTFADSQLIHALEDARTSMGERQEAVRVVGANRAVMRVLEICDLEQLGTDPH